MVFCWSQGDTDAPSLLYSKYCANVSSLSQTSSELYVDRILGKYYNLIRWMQYKFIIGFTRLWIHRFLFNSTSYWILQSYFNYINKELFYSVSCVLYPFPQHCFKYFLVFWNRKIQWLIFLPCYLPEWTFSDKFLLSV